MNSMWRKMMQALGLVDEYSDEEAPVATGNQEQPRPVPAGPASNPPPPGNARSQTPASRAVRPQRPNQPHLPANPPPYASLRRGVVVRPGTPATTTAEAEIIAAQEIDDAKRIADLIRERIPVVVDLRDAEPDMARRIVDFSSGLTYALDGNVTKSTRGVILVTPPRVELSSREMRRLSSMGLYDLDA